MLIRSSLVRCGLPKHRRLRLGCLSGCQGVTLIELIIFMIIMAISMMAISGVFQRSVIRVQDPLIYSQLLSMAQSLLDETSSRKYDENTPTGGVPSCNSPSAALACAGFGLDLGEVITDISTLDDIDDFDGYQDTPQTGYQRVVSVSDAVDHFGVTAGDAKRIAVSVTAPNGYSVTLSTYRLNF